MQEISIVALLQKYSGEIAACAVIACLISFIIIKIKKRSQKSFLIGSFISGIAIYSVYGCFKVRDFGAAAVVANAVTSGALAVALSMFIKRFLALNNNDIRKSLEKLLSSIVLEGELDAVIDGIIEKLAAEPDVTQDELKKLIRDKVSVELNEDDLNNVVSFILAAANLGSDDESDEKK